MNSSSDKPFQLVFVIIICMTLFFTFKPSQHTNDSIGISVSGQGIAKVQPDTLTLNFSIQEKAETTKEAQTKIDELSSQFITLIGTLGVEKKQIQTSNYSVYQHYYRDSETNKQQSDGYNASQNITVTLKGENFIQLGQEVLSAAPTVGNIQINSSSFSVTDKASSEAEARTLAIEHAKKKAEQLAQTAGVKLGKPLQISESVSAGNYYPRYANAMINTDFAKEEASYDSVSLEAGENEVSVSVNISYEIK
ncbi:MAG: SIMPL domain-containing protein [Candidatus Peribacteria bacterium]|jgi:uncharacterized protein YggE|nr:SIMPL domain-containing protein [Candidatus Peribacteria bacterium]